MKKIQVKGMEGGEEEEEGEEGEDERTTYPSSPSKLPPRYFLLVVLFSILCQGNGEWLDGEEDVVSPTPPHMGPAEGK